MATRGRGSAGTRRGRPRSAGGSHPHAEPHALALPKSRRFLALGKQAGLWPQRAAIQIVGLVTMPVFTEHYNNCRPACSIAIVGLHGADRHGDRSALRCNAAVRCRVAEERAVSSPRQPHRRRHDRRVRRRSDPAARDRCARVASTTAAVSCRRSSSRWCCRSATLAITSSRRGACDVPAVHLAICAALAAAVDGVVASSGSSRLTTASPRVLLIASVAASLRWTIVERSVPLQFWPPAYALLAFRCALVQQQRPCRRSASSTRSCCPRSTAWPRRRVRHQDTVHLGVDVLHQHFRDRVHASWPPRGRTRRSPQARHPAIRRRCRSDRLGACPLRQRIREHRCSGYPFAPRSSGSCASASRRSGCCRSSPPRSRSRSQVRRALHGRGYRFDVLLCLHSFHPSTRRRSGATASFIHRADVRAPPPLRSGYDTRGSMSATVGVIFVLSASCMGS